MSTFSMSSARITTSSPPPASSSPSAGSPQQTSGASAIMTRSRSRAQTQNQSSAVETPSRLRQTSEALRRSREKARQLSQSLDRQESRKRRSSGLRQAVPEAEHTGDTTEEDEPVKQRQLKSTPPPSRQPRAGPVVRDPQDQADEGCEIASSPRSGSSPKRKAVHEHRAAFERPVRRLRLSPSASASALDVQPKLKDIFTAAHKLRSVQSLDGQHGSSFVASTSPRTCDIKQCPLLLSLGFGLGCSKAHYDRITPAGMVCISSTKERKDWVHGQVHAWQKGKQRMKTLTGLVTASDWTLSDMAKCGEGWDMMLKEGWERVWCGEEAKAAATNASESEDKENGEQPAPPPTSVSSVRGVLNVIATGELSFETPEEDAPPSPRCGTPIATSASTSSYHAAEKKFDIWQSPPGVSEATKRIWRRMMGAHPGM